MAEFWTLTPRLVMLVLVAEMQRRNDESELHANLAAYTAWRVANLMRVKRLPDKPDTLFKNGKTTKGKSSGPDWRAQKRVFEMMNKMFGGTDNRPEPNGSKD